MRRTIIIAWLLALLGCTKQKASVTSAEPANQGPFVNPTPASQMSFDSPEHAVEALLAAYQSRDIDKMVAAKDFALDAKIFWQDLGLPLSEKQMKESVSAFEVNFRKQMKEDGIPDYRATKHSFTGREQPQENLVVLTMDLKWPDGRDRKLKLPALKTGSQWKAVRIPAYDHL